MRADRTTADKNDVLHRQQLGAWDAISGLPLLTGSDKIPEVLWPFHNLREAPDETEGVHFYSEDYKFERVWRQPKRYGEKLRGRVVLTPDFSLFLDDPPPVQIWNVYRARLVGQIWEEMGLDVIPSMQWADQRSWPFAFAGLREGGVVAVSTVGIGSTRPGSREAARQFRYGYVEMCERLIPQVVLLYGDVDLEPALLDLAPVKIYRPERTLRMRKAKRKKHEPHPEQAQLRLVQGGA